MQLKVWLLNLFLLNVNCYELSRLHLKRHAWAYSNRIHIGCISSDSFVQLNSREKKAIDRLNSGDELLTIDDESSELISTEMILMLDQQAFQTNWFYTIETESNHKISLTEYHLIPIEHFQNQRKYLFAKQIQIGDFLFVSKEENNNSIEITKSKVIEIVRESKEGFYSPLTRDGTLLVNGILVSSYAHVYDHWLAHQSMSFVRLIYRLSKYLNANQYLFQHSFQQFYSFYFIYLLKMFDFCTTNFVFT